MENDRNQNPNDVGLELALRDREIRRLKVRLAAAEKDRDAWRAVAGGIYDDRHLHCCLGTGRTGLLRAIREAFA